MCPVVTLKNVWTDFDDVIRDCFEVTSQIPFFEMKPPMSIHRYSASYRAIYLENVCA